MIFSLLTNAVQEDLVFIKRNFKEHFSGKDENKRNHMMAICTKTTLFSLQKNTDILWDYTYVYTVCKAIRSEDVERKNAGGSWFLIGEWEEKM